MGHGPTAVPSRGTAPAPDARRPAVRGWRAPHMIEPAPAIVGRLVLRPIAPPGEATRRRRDECAPSLTQSCACLRRSSVSISIGVWLTTSSSALWFHTSHSSGAMLKSPTIKVGSANFSDQRVIRSMKSSFWPNLGFTLRSGMSPPAGDRHSRGGFPSRVAPRRAVLRHCPASRGVLIVKRHPARIATPWCIFWPLSS